MEVKLIPDTVGIRLLGKGQTNYTFVNATLIMLFRGEPVDPAAVTITGILGFNYTSPFSYSVWDHSWYAYKKTPISSAILIGVQEPAAGISFGQVGWVSVGNYYIAVNVTATLTIDGYAYPYKRSALLCGYLPSTLTTPDVGLTGVVGFWNATLGIRGG
jgi:hypothetical protein